MRVCTSSPAFKSTRGKLSDLFKKLQTLAPNPAGDSDGPVFLHDNPNLRQPAEYDGMLGGMILDSVLGMAFSQAANDSVPADSSAGSGSPCGNFNYSHAADAASEYLKDRYVDKRTYIKGAGKGTDALYLGNKKLAPDAFKKAANPWAAYRRDLPKRRRIEAAMAGALRQLDELAAAEKYDYLPELTL